MLPFQEDLYTEFKSDSKTISDTVIVDEVVALANTKGGNLYIGIEDDGTVTGAQEVHRNPVALTALIANNTMPSLSVRSYMEEEGPFTVAHVEVPEARAVVATRRGRTLRRRLKADGSPECVPLYPFDITTRLSDLCQLDMSAQPVVEATREDFDAVERDRLRRMVETYPNSDKSLLELPDTELEKALRLTVGPDGEETPTLAGLLMIGKTASLKRLIPTHEAAFQVLEGTDVRVNVSYFEPLLSTIERIIDAVEPWNPVREMSFGPINQPVPLYDRRAVREAVVNAFGHRDYSVLGRVRVVIDDFGLQIVNPGGFIEGITVSNLLTAEPYGRNPCLMDALKRVGLAERTGRGIDRIYEGSLLYGRPLPDYSDSDSTKVSVFLTKKEPDEAFARMVAEERRRKGSAIPVQSLLILNELKAHKQCTLGDLEKSVDVAKSRLTSVVGQLVDEGLVDATASDAATVYTLAYMGQTELQGADKVLQPSEVIMRFAEQRGYVTTADVRELLHLPKNQNAYYEITKLVKQNKLQITGSGRGSRYIPVKG